MQVSPDLSQQQPASQQGQDRSDFMNGVQHQLALALGHAQQPGQAAAAASALSPRFSSHDLQLQQAAFVQQQQHQQRQQTRLLQQQQQQQSQMSGKPPTAKSSKP